MPDDIPPPPAARPDVEEECRRLRLAVAEQARDGEMLAYDMHDGLAQYLAGAAMHLGACDLARLDEATAAEVTAALRLVRKADAETRRLMQAQLGKGQPPRALDDLGLAAALDMIAADARGQGIDVQVTAKVPETTMPPHLAPAIYRIVHEAVGNAVRHAAPRRVHVVVDHGPGGLRIHVCDDGRGFDPTHVPATCLGLEGIRRRARLLGGTARIESRPGAGTAIDVVLPA